MVKQIASICVCLSLILVGRSSINAGGAIETIDITGGVASPIPGHLIARVVGIKWDTRCIPVPYRVNSTLDPVPNPLGDAFLTLTEATPALQQSFDAWNQIPTSFIDMRIVGSVSNPDLRGFDMVNEVTFRTDAGFGAIAASASTVLIEDSNLVNGDDIDEDGDSDVSNMISSSADVDGDGDIEFPEGLYKAGTILDNDVQFNTKASNGFRFTVDKGDLDTNARSVDLMAVAVHEFGHSHGLAHSMNNQISANDGSGATMFPFIDTGDPGDELSQRSLDSDDVTFSSFFYQEGSANTGLAALQAGDVAFFRVFGLVTGQLHHGRLDLPIAGGHVFAIHRQTGALVAGAFSGTTQVSFDPATGGRFVVSPSFNVLDGKYTLPVPRGRFDLGVEAVDGQPAPSGSFSLTAQIGSLLGQQTFNEEFLIRNIRVNAGQAQTGIDLVTSRTINIRNFSLPRSAVGFINASPGFLYAVRIPASQVAEALSSEDRSIQAAEFYTDAFDHSVAPVFAEALVTTGVVNDDGLASIDLDNPLARTTSFVGQDNDLAPFFFRNPRQLARRVRREIDEGHIQNLFLVLRVPSSTPFPGVSGVPPLISLDSGGSILNLSFTSNDGGMTFTPESRFNFMFGLVLAEPSPVDEPEEDN